MPVSRVLVNENACFSGMGKSSRLNFSFTLGCGTDSGCSTTDNITFTHLLNIRRIAMPVGQPLFKDKMEKHQGTKLKKPFYLAQS
jgi:hypothetical protein